LTSPGNLESLKKLLTAGLVDLKRPIYDVERDILFSFLLAAVEWQGVEDDKRLLFILHSPKSLLNEPSSVGTLPLTAAIRCDRLDLVSKLVEAGADVNLVFQEYGTISTPFMIAIQLKRNNIVAFLLSTDKVDPNLVLPDGSNALTLLVTYQPTEIYNWFPKLVDGQRKMTGEFFFCVLHPFFIAKHFILKNIIDSVVREQLNWLLTPVTAMAYIATRENDLNMLRFLNDIGSKFNSYRSEQGFGLIHVAAWEGFTEIVEFLIQTGADVNLLVGNDAKTSAIQMAFSGGHFDLVCKLIRLGATAGLPGVIQAAITTGNRQIICALLSTGITSFPNLPNGYNLVTSKKKHKSSN
ncbi:ankyrin 1 like, partial [Perkinsus sp. BL_2016]